MKFDWNKIELASKQYLTELPDGLWEREIGGTLFCSCRSCEREMEWEGTIDDWVDGGDRMAFCGGSSNCCP